MFCKVGFRQHLLDDEDSEEEICLPVPVMENLEAKRKQKLVFSELEVRYIQCMCSLSTSYQVTSQSFTIQRTYTPLQEDDVLLGSWNGLKNIHPKAVMLSDYNRRTCLLPNLLRAIEAESPILSMLAVFNPLAATPILDCYFTLSLTQKALLGAFSKCHTLNSSFKREARV